MTDVVLISGATRGLGLTTARRLARHGMTVLLGARDLDRGRDVADELRADLGDEVPSGAAGRVQPIELDVTDDASVAAAVAAVDRDHGRLDVLINNAGVGGDRSPADHTGADELREVYRTNVEGPVRLTHGFLALLRRASNPRVVMVSSGMGSFALTADPERIESRMESLAYASSKSALNMITRQYAKALFDVHVNAVDPGLSATEMTGGHGHTLEEGTDAVVAAALAGPDGPTGTYTDRNGPLPW